MTPEPRQREDYSERQVEAAHRVIVDIGQVLASFADCMVLVGGWVPDFLIPDAHEPHIGSIDVDFVLDAANLGDGRYAEMLNLLIATKRYRPGEKHFQLVVDVDLGDGDKPVQVEVEFLAPKEVRLQKNRPKLLENFRVLQTDGCGVAFNSPVEQTISGVNVRGAKNTIRLRLASLSDFLVMKARAIGQREKPKDVYDLCYCLDHVEGGMETLAKDWRERIKDDAVERAIAILREKFADTGSFGPQMLIDFHNSPNLEEQEMQAQRAYQLVRKFLNLIDGA